MSTLRTLADALRGVERFIVREGERLLVEVDGRFEHLFGPGEHVVATRDRLTITHRFDITGGTAQGPLVALVANRRPDLVEGQLIEVHTAPRGTAAIYRDGVLFGLVPRDSRVFLWVDAGPWTVEHYDTVEGLRVPEPLAGRLARPKLSDPVKRIEVGHDQVGVLFVDGVMAETLSPGAHVFWTVGPKVEATLIDTRRTTLEVAQQEFLTADRVTVRVNLSVVYRVVDPVAAVTGAHDFAGALYREAQFALRRTLGTMTLDRILAEQVDIDPAPVRAAMASLGVEVSELAVKDVILPGEMRAILNQVVAAEKQAEANVIRRREETNATRSLLNTAKVMAENPVMLRLKELEALQELAGKVERLTVHNGTGGLMNDLVRLRD